MVSTISNYVPPCSDPILSHHGYLRLSPSFRHAHNFLLLFASNVENLVACMLRKYIDSRADDLIESLLAILYIYFVAKNLLWFIEPLKERDDYALLLTWYEDRAEFCSDKLHCFISKIRPWTKKFEDKKAGFNGTSCLRRLSQLISVHRRKKMADAVRLVQSANTLSKVAKANKPEESQKERAEAKRN